jgi:DNA-binding MarR family transcriptional regulator
MTILQRNASAGYMTNWAARLFARAMDRRIAHLGLSSGQLPVIFALADGGSLSQKALTEAAAIEQPTMAATLARMEKAGLVTRTADPTDRRRSLVQLTPSALAQVTEVQQAVADVNEAALAGLSPADRKTYLRLLDAVAAGLEAATGA